jgi:hypothetical protein
MPQDVNEEVDPDPKSTHIFSMLLLHENWELEIWLKLREEYYATYPHLQFTPIKNTF